MPLMPKWVDRQAGTVEPMQRVTWYGPTRGMALLRRMSAGSIWVGGAPGGGGVMWGWVVAWPMKRGCLRSIGASRSIGGTPATWLRMPNSLNWGMARMPERPARSDCVTVAMSLPMHETMPVPVITTRFMLRLLVLRRLTPV